MTPFKKCTCAALITGLSYGSSFVAADTFAEVLKKSTVTGDFRLRYEDVEAGAVNSDGLTLRSRLGFKTNPYRGFTALIEIEDVRDVFGVDDESNLIPDPEVTEIDQAFIQYKDGNYTVKLGRQVLTLDGHRFLGHVGWRQDRQTFDALRVQLSPMKDLSIDIAYIDQRNRIFGEDLDAESSDILFNASYKTALGKLVGYAYLLDDDTRDEQSDTVGVSLSGATDSDIKFMYAVEYASQSIEDSGIDFDTEYMMLEVGAIVSGMTFKIGQEVLGSDDGLASFTTPLATLHKFNGWNDIFLGGTFNPAAMPDGLEDLYFVASGKLLGTKLTLVYHDFSADEDSTDYGDELGVSLTKAYKSGVSVGIKYSTYDADNYGVDTDKLWISTAYKF
ncbi:MAG: hypothetical protein ACI89U_001692 [Gammaproteobacteria bacterium]|jgi:hypothetical protein